MKQMEEERVARALADILNEWERMREGLNVRPELKARRINEWAQRLGLDSHPTTKGAENVG